jgi:NAD(P)-dependent dehydrogenase (short-subunit alcohol dehydrogenase family)
VDLAGRNVVLTGVGRAGQVGEIVALTFAQHGARLFLVDHQLATAQERANALTGAAFDARAFGADLSDATAVSRLAQSIGSAADNTLHAVVHMAGGFAMSGSVAESDPAIWTRQLSINATTAYLTARAFIPMLRATRGALVFFASEAVLPGANTAGKSAYAAAKGAVVTLMQSVAQEEREHGVRANAVAPTSIRTAANLASMGSDAAYVSREEVANVVLWLCSDAARVVNGQLVRIR